MFEIQLQPISSIDFFFYTLACSKATQNVSYLLMTGVFTNLRDLGPKYGCVLHWYGIMYTYIFDTKLKCTGRAT